MLRARGPSWEKPESLQDPFNPQHELVTTMVKGSNGKMIRVRCKCMAEYKNIDSSRYFAYDYLADVNSLAQVASVYDNHLRAATILITVAKFHRELEGS